MHPNGQQQQPTVFEIRDGNAMYIVQALIIRNLDLQKTEENGSLYVNLTLSMHNPYGYLSAVDYPALVVSKLFLFLFVHYPSGLCTPTCTVQLTANLTNSHE